MATFFLVIIYLTFIGLGLPDSILGSAWSAMRLDLNAQLSSAGIISMIVSGGTIVSSLLSGKLVKRFGSGKITFVSVTMTAAALLSFSFAPSFIWLCLLAIPLGLGAGAVDSVLNNFIALHYKSKHMSWLHCFWGIGATGGPLIMSLFIAKSNGWRNGYFIISMIQIFIAVTLLFTLPLWKRFEENANTYTEEQSNIQGNNIFSIKGVKLTLLSFFCYCAIEMTAGLWGSSYLVNIKGIAVDTAAGWISLFYMGITIGRFVTGFITMKLSNRSLIRIGQFIIVLGAAIFILPLPNLFLMVGFILIGLGCAPIYPCMLHETPKRFGDNLSQSMMGVQMASAYVGSTFMPPLFGYVATVTGMSIFPLFILVLVFVMIICIEKLNTPSPSKGGI